MLDRKSAFGSRFGPQRKILDQLAQCWKGKPALALVPAALALLLMVGAVREFTGDIFSATGQRYFAAGGMKEATTHLAKGVALQQWPGKGTLYLGLAKVATGDAAKARLLLEMSIAEKPTFEGYLALAELSIDENRFQEAGELLTVVENCEPFMNFRLQAAYLRGLSELRQGHQEKARDRFRALLQNDPLNQRAWLALGYQEVLAGNQDQARIYYLRALEIIEMKLRDTISKKGPESQGSIARLTNHRKAATKALESVKSK